MENFDIESVNESLPYEQILKRVSCEEIYKHFLGFDFEVNKKYSSPFREDKVPSFVLYYTDTEKGKALYWKDFNGDFGNCFTLVQKLRKVSFLASLGIITEEMGLLSGKKRDMTIVPLSTQAFRRRKKINITTKIFTEEELEWWNQFGVTKSILKRFGVKSVDRYFVDKKFVSMSSRKKPIYGYIFSSGNIKLYMPTEAKQFRFLSNTVSSDIQGLEQLDSTKDILIITKSMKDVMCLYSLGYTAIAPQAEGNKSLPLELYRYILGHFDKSFVLFDNDKAGREGGDFVASVLGLKSFYLPLNVGKDISDVYKDHGRRCALDLIKSFNE